MIEEHDIELITKCLRLVEQAVGDGFVWAEDAFCEYSEKSGDEDWETLPVRMERKLRVALTPTTKGEG